MMRSCTDILGLCALLLCCGMAFSAQVSADCHGQQPSSAQVADASHDTIQPHLSGNSPQELSTSAKHIEHEPIKHSPEGHDCCDGDMSQCPMAQCASALYASPSEPSNTSALRPETYFETLRTGAPHHPNSTLFRPPIVS